ncbi:hypothetical protein PUMCH_004368 [Australozyma saopauloensis]|uniref:Uncharacterized protein n=1 Tax=Australozyma saopauloensis TaxID=291208 RepID=A0AAX4HGK7_9ASCO|nr:hypothetical protein PUMCH_004368 [[Candida] saopauloensis]
MRSEVQKWATQIKKKAWIISDTVSLGNVAHMRNLLTEIVPAEPESNKSLYGYSFLFNTQTNSDLGIDGYDNYQAPKSLSGQPLYLRRMWAGGEFEFVKKPHLGEVINCRENITAARTIGNATFVLINRDFKSSSSSLINELRTLIYTNEPFQETKREDSPEQSFDHLFKTKFTLQHIMRYNFLTYNLHKIHYDAEFCRREGFPNVLVSGPFMVLILLHYFCSKYAGISIRKFKYRNSRPCFIDTDVTLGIKEGHGCFEVQLLCGQHIACSGVISPKL